MYYMNNYGVQIEKEFVNNLNNKAYGEINYLLRLFINDLYEKDFHDSERIECVKISGLYKTDITIKIQNITKYISIKSGSRNSVHTIRISEFIHFLINNNIPRDIIIDYLKYHYADGTINGTGKNRISASEYKMFNQENIKNINKYLNKKEIVEKVIDKFILGKNNSFKGIDVIIYGTPNNFLYIKDNDIKKILFKFLNFKSSGIHFSKIFCQPADRCLNYNSKYEDRRYLVQLKWYSLFDDIIYNMNNNQN